MKKILSMILVVVFCLASIGASAAQVPSFMEKLYNNYTANYKMSMKVNNAKEIAGFLKELDMEHIDKFLNVEALIESLFEVDSVLNVEAEVSEDFRKISAGITAETNKDMVYNKNYKSSHCAKAGIWMKLDVDKKEFYLICSTPFNEKYALIDAKKHMTQEETDAFFDMYDKLLNREVMEAHNKEIMKIAAEHADISVKGKTATIHYDNDSFIALIEGINEYMKSFYCKMALDVEGEPIEYPELPSLEGLKLLGKDGITCTLDLSGDVVTGFSEKWDVSIGLADIYTRVAEEPWEYVFDGNIDISFEVGAEVSKVGTTKVEFPAITEENSFDFIETMDDIYGYDDYYYEDTSEPYIYDYVWGGTDTDTFDGERYYVPVRYSIEYAYEDYSTITYDKGLVTITTNTGIVGRDINASFKVGEDTAVVNGVTYEGLGAFRMIDGSVYASTDFYEKCLGWSLTSLSKNLLRGTLSYGFRTVKDE